MQHRVIPTDLIDPNPAQPRKHFDASALAELGESIRAHGLIQPIAVRRQGDRFQIIAGERRWRAVGPGALIDAVVLDGKGDEETFVLSTVENVNRKDMTPIEEANAYAAIVAMGRSVEDVASLFGKATFAVSWRLELLNLAPEFQGAEMPMNVARLLSRLGIDAQRAAMHRYMGNEFKTVQEFERYCKTVIARDAQADLFAPAQVDGFGCDDLRRERSRVNRTKIADAWTRVTTIAAAFGPIDECSEQDVADALDGDLDRYLNEVRQLEAHARRARILLENAKALQKASVA